MLDNIVSKRIVARGLYFGQSILSVNSQECWPGVFAYYPWFRCCPQGQMTIKPLYVLVYSTKAKVRKMSIRGDLTIITRIMMIEYITSELSSTDVFRETTHQP